MKYLLYIRKSTDEEDRQVLSLESQETELVEFATKEKFEIAEIFRESQTAKEPGRPVFNQMLARLEKGHAQGIIAWHPDRLARNSIDGGKIIYFIDTNKIQSLKFPTFWFEATPQGKFMLNIAFGQSKYFVDNLSENTKRGLRQKVRRGELPGYAPLGYLNDLQKHIIIRDPERFELVKKLFVFYSTGNYSLKALQKIIARKGLKSRNNKVIPISNLERILKKPFYYGLFKFNGELHQGTHEPMISKKLFDKCQKVMSDRSRPRKREQTKDYAFRGFLTCGECGCAITSETQKGHIYYRCTKKKNDCNQPYVREEVLDQQITQTLQKVSLAPAWADCMIEELNREEKSDTQAGAAFAQNLKNQIGDCDKKLDILLDAHLDGAISKTEYSTKKQKILNQKIELTEKLSDFEQRANHWLERAKKFILEAKQAQIIALQENLFAKKDFLKKIGSNHILADRTFSFLPKNAWNLLYTRKPSPLRGEGLSSYLQCGSGRGIRTHDQLVNSQLLYH